MLLPMDVNNPSAVALAASCGSVAVCSTPYTGGHTLRYEEESARQAASMSACSGDLCGADGRSSPTLEVDAEVAKNLYQCVRLEATDAQLTVMNGSDSTLCQDLIEPFSIRACMHVHYRSQVVVARRVKLPG